MRTATLWMTTTLVCATLAACFEDDPAANAPDSEAADARDGGPPRSQGRTNVDADAALDDANPGADARDADAPDASPDADARDADAPDASPDADAAVETCEGPFVTLEAAAYDHVTDDGVGGAIVASNLCPDAPVVTDEYGRFMIQVPKGKDFYLRTTGPGYAPTLSPELRFDDDGLTTVQVFPEAPTVGPLAALFAAGPLFVPIAVSNDDFPPGGVTIALSGGAPNVIYPSAAWVETGGASTDASGHVVAYGMNEATVLEMTPSKAGCNVIWYTNNQTGRLRFERGAVTAQHIWVECDLFD